MFVNIKKSNLPGKKMMAIFYDINNNKIKTVHFGQAGASDFTINKNPEQKKRYIERHSKNENWDDPMSAGALSRWILWNKPTKTESIKDYKNKFGIY